MGYMVHHAIIVTSFDQERLGSAHRKALDLFTAEIVTNVVNSYANSIQSFLIAPDGSKEGWEASDQGDRRREQFVHWLDGQRWEDGSNNLDWCLVQFGDDGRDDRMLDSSELRRERTS